MLRELKLAFDLAVILRDFEQATLLLVARFSYIASQRVVCISHFPDRSLTKQQESNRRRGTPVRGEEGQVILT